MSMWAKERFPDGQLYVDFAALRDQVTPMTGPGGDVSEALAMCLRALPGGDIGIPDSLLDRTNLFRSRTAGLRILLVLDDVNQAAQVRAPIPKGPGSAVLATSSGRIGEGVLVPQSATFRDLRDFMDAVLIASGVPPRSVQVRMRHGTLAETLDTYGFALEVDWENAPAPFEELFGIPVPSGLPEAALVPRAERIRRGSATAPAETSGR